MSVVEQSRLEKLRLNSMENPSNDSPTSTVNMLPFPSLKELAFENIDIDRTVLKAFFTGMQTNRSMQRLLIRSIYYNLDLQDMMRGMELCDMLQRNTTLQSLELPTSRMNLVGAGKLSDGL